MRLNAGRVEIDRPLERVYSFLTHLENLDKQIPKETIDDYEIDFDDNLSGEMEIGCSFNIYFFAIYEGDRDRCCEVEVVGIEKNREIRLELRYVGKYNEEKDDWSDPILIEENFGILGFEMRFQRSFNRTQIIMFNTFSPKSKALEIVIRIGFFLGGLSRKRHYKKWVKLVEQYA